MLYTERRYDRTTEVEEKGIVRRVWDAFKVALPTFLGFASFVGSAVGTTGLILFAVKRTQVDRPDFFNLANNMPIYIAAIVINWIAFLTSVTNITLTLSRRKVPHVIQICCGSIFLAFLIASCVIIGRDRAQWSDALPVCYVWESMKFKSFCNAVMVGLNMMFASTIINSVVLSLILAWSVFVFAKNIVLDIFFPKAYEPEKEVLTHETRYASTA